MDLQAKETHENPSDRSAGIDVSGLFWWWRGLGVGCSGLRFWWPFLNYRSCAAFNWQRKSERLTCPERRKLNQAFSKVC